MGLIDRLTRQFLAAYREGLQMSCTHHCERTKQFAENARKRREKIRSALNERSRRAH
ncbi:MAG: hypothetical protein JSR96_02585 [Proteobacteria bacterium]|nr:hypothetical protein [Pseudomonadota bacterium]